MNKAADDFAIGPRLRRLRTGLGLSQRELARRAGVSNATISMIEADRVSPSIAGPWLGTLNCSRRSPAAFSFSRRTNTSMSSEPSAV